jgi:hypothetical protein
MLDWLHEVELYREFIKKLNKLGFQFEDTSKKKGYSDLIDAINRIIVEVKLGKDVAEDGASQILYGMAREKLENFLYVGLADSELFHVFKSPEYGDILTFATELDENLEEAPSKFTGKKIAEAMVVLGEPIWQGFWKDTTDDISKILNSDAKIPFIAENLFALHRIFGLYKIKTTDIISAFTDTDILSIKITKNRIIIAKVWGDPVVIKYKGKMKLTHKWIFERLRIPNLKAVLELRQTTDRLQTDEKRANRGAYYTEQLLSIEMGNKVLKYVKPDFIIEPYAGAGSLLIPFLTKGYKNGWVNDYDEGAAGMLSSDYGTYGYTVTCVDMIDLPIEEALKIIGDVKEPLFITNPPFSSTSGSKIKIEYGEFGDVYGRGNQIYPTIGKIIEIIKKLGCGYLAFFSPMGIFCERKSHMKILNGILNNFEFVYGSIWSGIHFNDVRKEIPVAFTIWKFGGSTELETIQFECENYGLLGFKRYMLLKDGWKYLNLRPIRNEIVIGRNDYFNCPQIKVFGNSIKNGAEVIQENVKQKLNIDDIPDELVYALWASIVGQKSLGRSSADGFPLYTATAYVHLPDFNRIETKEILAYSLIYAFVAPDYTEGKIGFIGPRKIMKFGDSQRLNDGARYLFETYGNLSVGEQTIIEVLEAIKKDERKDDWRVNIIKEISQRLDAIGYWNYIPLPLKKKEKILEWLK